MQFSNAKDKSPIYEDMTYHGVVKEIWELGHCAFRFPFLNVIGLKVITGSRLIN